jgi:four helix bundle protein
MAGETRFEDLLSWQRMMELNVEILRITEHGPASRDYTFRDEIRDAADSAQRNVAEGFGRYGPIEFARFLDFSRASAQETKALLRKGLAAGYWGPEDHARLEALATRGLQAVAKFQRYLRSPAAKRNAARRYQRRKNDPNA